MPTFTSTTTSRSEWAYRAERTYIDDVHPAQCTDGVTVSSVPATQMRIEQERLRSELAYLETMTSPQRVPEPVGTLPEYTVVDWDTATMRPAFTLGRESNPSISQEEIAEVKVEIQTFHLKMNEMSQKASEQYDRHPRRS